MNVFCEKIGETIAYEEYPDGVRIIPHNKLEDILRRYSARFIIEVKPVLISPEMCLVECRATDKETGETVLKVGESNPQTKPQLNATEVTVAEWALGMPPSPKSRRGSKVLFTIIIRLSLIIYIFIL